MYHQSTSTPLLPNGCYALVADFSALNFNRSKFFVFFCGRVKDICIENQ